MSQVLKDLLSLLKLEQIEHGIYRGQSQDLGFKALFGGQVMGQALSAAQETVDAERQVHSLLRRILSTTCRCTKWQKWRPS